MPKKFNQWLVGTLTAIVIALGTWGLSAVPSLSERMAVAETKIKAQEKVIDKMDKKLDEILDRLPARRRNE